MPSGASEAFLLWHDAAASGQWNALLSAPATKDGIWALWLLQTYPLRPPGQVGTAAQGREAALEAARADGWGR